MVDNNDLFNVLEVNEGNLGGKKIKIIISKHCTYFRHSYIMFP